MVKHMHTTDSTHTPLELNPSRDTAHQVFERAFDNKPDDWSTANTWGKQPIRLSFSGRGRDYLSLWLTNWILTIVTLGIYSAWAKVRRLQYTHQNTQLGGYAFNFHGEPKSILVGRLIAIGLLVAASLGDFFSEFALLVSVSSLFSLLLSAAYPWFIRSSMRFYARNSSYRNVRFKFKGGTGELYRIYIFGGFLTLITLGLAFPYLAYRLRRYHVENNYWGNNKLDFNATKRSFFGIYLLHFVITLLVYAVITALAFKFGQPYFKELSTSTNTMRNPSTEAIIFVFLVLFVFFVLYKISTAITQDMIYKLSWNHTSIAKSQFSCDLSVFSLYLIRLGCFVLSLLTLGFFTPFAQMIILKKRIESLSFTPAHDFDLNQAHLDIDTTRSAEVAEMMDFDIAW